MPELNPCRLCGFSGMPKPLFSGIVKCPGCGLDYFPDNADTSALYQRDYFHGAEYQSYSEEKEILQRNFRPRLEDILKKQSSGKLLEIGCAYGFFLDLAKAHFQVKGVDITVEGTESARKNFGVNTICADFSSLPDESGSYDVICLWDTIEHLPEPFVYLKKAAAWLKPGGHLWLTTGDIGSHIARARGAKWRQIHPPTHLYYFDRSTIEKALLQAGLKMEKFEHVGQYRSLRTMAYVLFVLRSRRFKWLYDLFTLGGRFDLPVYLNTYDIMQVTAIKPLQGEEHHCFPS